MDFFFVFFLFGLLIGSFWSVLVMSLKVIFSEYMKKGVGYIYS